MKEKKKTVSKAIKASPKKTTSGKPAPAKPSKSKNVKSSAAAKSQKKSAAQAPKKSVAGKKTKPATKKPVAVAQKVKPAAKKIDDRKKKKVKISDREKKILEIKQTLMSQKTSLLEEAEVALNELPGQTIFPDLGDQATAETDRNFMLRLRGREQRLLKKIDEAIERIDGGLFGLCEECGQDIDIKRLEARPVTTMCIDCKTLQEEEEKLRAQ